MPYKRRRFSSRGNHSISGWRVALNAAVSFSKAQNQRRNTSFLTLTFSCDIARAVSRLQGRGEVPTVLPTRPPQGEHRATLFSDSTAAQTAQVAEKARRAAERPPHCGMAARILHPPAGDYLLPDWQALPGRSFAS